MPIYESFCTKCGAKQDYYQSVDNRHDTPLCCGNKTVKHITKIPGLICDIQPWDAYVSPATGKYITSKSERRTDFKASGCREWEGMASERKASAESKKQEEARQDKVLDETARKTWAQFDPKKKAKLLKASV